MQRPTGESGTVVGMVIRELGGKLEVWDAACGACPACSMGLRDACEAPVAPVEGNGQRWLQRPAADASLLEVAAAAHDLVSQAAGRPAVLVLGAGPPARAAAAAAAGAGAAPVVLLGEAKAAPGVDATVDERESRVLLATGPSGRADLVLAADGDLARAARIVRRGGAIAALGASTTRPSITVMVQRELELRPVRDRVRAALDCRVEA
jgi:threonine dehydrogenase-like Zn-dependent dehydrogenase